MSLESSRADPVSELTLEEAKERRKAQAKARRAQRVRGAETLPLKPRHPPLVMSIHGIRTRAEWQKILQSVLSGTPTTTESHDYDEYGLVKFLIPYFNNRRIEAFREWYENMVTRHQDRVDLHDYRKRPSLVAHSLGSWIAGYAMLKYKEIRFDRLILAGSILPRDFDWGKMFSRDQVSSVRNECGKLDRWPGWAARLVARAGSGGFDGFEWFGTGTSVETSNLEWFDHSDALMRAHMEEDWVPYFRQPPSALGLHHGKDILDGETFQKLLNHTGTVVDRDAYASLPHYREAEIPRGLSTTWIKVNPDIYTFLMNRSTSLPAGYLNAMPVDDVLYAGIRAGHVVDNEVQAHHLLPYLGPRTIKIYLMSIAIEEKYRRWGDGPFQQAYIQLMTGFFEKLMYYAKHDGIRVSHFLATAWTPEGHVICNWFKGESVGRDKFGDTIYELDFSVFEDPVMRREAPPPLRRLLDVYQEMTRAR